MGYAAFTCDCGRTHETFNTVSADVSETVICDCDSIVTAHAPSGEGFIEVEVQPVQFTDGYIDAPPQASMEVVEKLKQSYDERVLL